MTNTTESLAPVVLPGPPDINASSAAYAEYARICARLVLVANMRTPVNGPHRPSLVVVGRHWARDDERQAAAQILFNEGEYSRAIDMLGVPEYVLLSSDGRVPDLPHWCRCDGVDAAEWVYVERWEARGLAFHGWVHGPCRRVLQTG